MSGADAPRDVPPEAGGATTGVGGTPFAVAASRGRARAVVAVFLAGPVIWTLHFLLVYTVAEAGCTGEGPGLALFNPPVPTVVTLAATAVAAVACLWCARWGYRNWRGSRGETAADAAGERPADLQLADPGGSLAFAGFLLSLLSFVTVLMVGLPALYLPAC